LIANSAPAAMAGRKCKGWQTAYCVRRSPTTRIAPARSAMAAAAELASISGAVVGPPEPVPPVGAAVVNGGSVVVKVVVGAAVVVNASVVVGAAVVVEAVVKGGAVVVGVA